jgi:hypothetical protein
MMKHSKKFYWCGFSEAGNAVWNAKVWLGSIAKRFMGHVNLHDIELGQEMNMSFQGNVTISHYLEGQDHVLDISLEINKEDSE